MKRQGLMLSKLDEKILGRLRYIFYKRSGLTKDRRLVVHPLGSIISYCKRGSSFDQQLEGGFTMVFRHYSLKADKNEYGKYDHLIYGDIEPEKRRTADGALQMPSGLKEAIAFDVTGEIEAFLVASGVAVEIEVKDIPAGRGARTTFPRR